jgi:hypothetical protein
LTSFSLFYFIFSENFVLKSVEAGKLLDPEDFPPPNEHHSNHDLPETTTTTTTTTKETKEIKTTTPSKPNKQPQTQTTKKELAHVPSLSIPLEDDENLVPVGHAKKHDGINY